MTEVPLQLLRTVLKAGECGERRLSVRSFSRMDNIDGDLARAELADPQVIKDIVVMQLCRAKAVLLEGQSLYEEAIDAASRALDRAQRYRLPTVEIPIIVQLGNLCRRAGNLDQAEQRLSAALKRALDASITSNDALVFYELGYIAHLRGRFGKAVDWFTKSLDAAARDNDLVGKLAAMASLARQHCLNGDASVALKLTADCDSLLTTSDPQLDADWVHRWRINNWAHELEVRLLQSHLRRAERLLDQVAAGTEALISQRAFNRSRTYLSGQLALARRKFPSAEANLIQYLNEIESSQGVQNAEAAAEPLVLLGRALASQGKHRDAMERFNLALSLRPDLGNRRGQAWACIDCAAAAHSKGRYDDARVLLERGLSMTADHYSPERLTIKKWLQKIV